MKILINASNLTKGGGIQVGDSFIRELVNHPEHQYMIVCSKQVAESLGDFLFKLPSFIQVTKRPPTEWKERLFRLLRLNPFLSCLCKEFSADAVFTIFGPSYWKPPVPHLCGFAQCFRLYLDSPFYRIISTPRRIYSRLCGMIYLFMFRHDSDIMVIETSDGKQRLQKIFPSKRIFNASRIFRDNIVNCFRTIST